MMIMSSSITHREDQSRPQQNNKLQILSSSSLLLLVLLLELGSLPAPSLCQQQELPMGEWVKNQPANAGKDVQGCAKKDAALSTAESNRVLVYVDPFDDGTYDVPVYKTIGEAITNIPDGNTKRYVVVLVGGSNVFREKVFIGRSKPFVTLQSNSYLNPAVIAWNDTTATLGKDGKPLGVDGSSTVTIESDYFIADGVVFRNDAPLPKADAAVENIGQPAPALRVLGSKATFYKCKIEGGQGALYDQKGLHYFKSCTINGTIDFIFGFAKSFYEDCNIVSVIDLPTDKLPSVPQEGGIKVAPGEGGFSFKTCTFSGQGSELYLGRAGWPVIYSYTEIAKEIVPLIVSDRGDIQQADRYHLHVNLRL